MTWREAFGLLQLEAEERIGAVQRMRLAEVVGAQDAAAGALRSAAALVGEE